MICEKSMARGLILVLRHHAIDWPGRLILPLETRQESLQSPAAAAILTATTSAYFDQNVD